MAFEFPSRGLVFWPVGCGDATTVVVDNDTVLQFDVNHLEAADDDEDPRVSVIDELVEHLPIVDERPYLSVFCLTHLDNDHCRGFEELLDRVAIGEMWVGSPSLESDPDLCDDAKVVQDEALRRLNALRNGSTGSGDKVKIFGPDEALQPYADLPEAALIKPGDEITDVDDVDRSDVLRVHVLAPIDCSEDRDRNDCGVGVQVNLFSDAGSPMRALLLGDRSYVGVTEVFDSSEQEDVEWNVLLAPHHCSRSVFYYKDEGAEEPTFRQNVVDSFEDSAGDPGWIVASCDAIPDSNASGDNPPHADARDQYEDIGPSGFLCTGEQPDDESPEPIVFQFDGEHLCIRGDDSDAAQEHTVTQAVAAARGANQAPKETVGFGQCR